MCVSLSLSLSLFLFSPLLSLSLICESFLIRPVAPLVAATAVASLFVLVAKTK